MSKMLSVEIIYRQERQRWIKEEAPRKSIREDIADSVPYWIILVALVLFGLSAPHSAGVFDKLTPGWGWVASIGVEFGLLYTAFRRRLINAMKQALPWTLWALEILLFLAIMLVNRLALLPQSFPQYSLISCHLRQCRGIWSVARDEPSRPHHGSTISVYHSHRNIGSG